MIGIHDSTRAAGIATSASCSTICKLVYAAGMNMQYHPRIAKLPLRSEGGFLIMIRHAVVLPLQPPPRRTS